MGKATDTKPGTLMQGLIYPAFLGAAFVWSVGYFAESWIDGSPATRQLWTILDYRHLLVVWLLCYFCAPYLILSKAELPRRYGWWSFLTDLGDVVVIFAAFYYLRQAAQCGAYGPGDCGNALAGVYGAIAVLPVLALVGNLLVGRRPRMVLSVLAFALCVGMALGGSMSVLLNWFAVVGLFVLLGAYFIGIEI